MRKLLNTLYVTSSDTYLARDGENVVVKKNSEVVFRIPIHNIEAIICFGYSGASPAVMALCAERGVALTFLNEHGRFLATIQGPTKGNILLRRTQYRLADDLDASCELAKSFITGKVLNARTVLQRGLRDHNDVVDVKVVERKIDYLKSQVKALQSVKSLEHLRGVEGDCAKVYFEGLDEFILIDKDVFFFVERTRRPPTDNFNALLSFVYMLLTHESKAALESVGIDAAAGFLHRDRPGRPSLALDLMEELRPYLADRLVLTLINKRQVDPSGFVKKENGAVIMDESTRKAVLEAWQKRKREIIVHPYLDEKVEIGLIPYVQALLLARFLRGDLDGYPPFLWR